MPRNCIPLNYATTKFNSISRARRVPAQFFSFIYSVNKRISRARIELVCSFGKLIVMICLKLLSRSFFFHYLSIRIAFAISSPLEFRRRKISSKLKLLSIEFFFLILMINFSNNSVANNFTLPEANQCNWEIILWFHYRMPKNIQFHSSFGPITFNFSV